MDFIFVVEPDPAHQRVLKQTVSALEGDLEAIFFDRNESLFHAIKSQYDLKRSNSKDFDERYGKVRLVVLDLDDPSIPSRIERNWRAVMRAFEILTGSVEKVPRCVGTCHENRLSGVEYRKYFKTFLSNLVIKPFDQLLLKQSLAMGLVKDNKLQVEEMFSLSTQSKIELIKPIDTVRVGDLGFTSTSSERIEVGRVARYYGNFFGEENNGALFARCMSSRPKEDGGGYFCEFSYFGPSSLQIGEVRRQIAQVADAKGVSIWGDRSFTSEKPRFMLLGAALKEHSIDALLDEIFEEMELESFDSIFEFSRSFSDKIISDEEREQLTDEFGFFKIKIHGEEGKIRSVDQFKNEKQVPATQLLNSEVIQQSFYTLLSSYMQESDLKALKELLIQGKLEEDRVFPLIKDGVDINVIIKSIENSMDADVGNVIVIDMELKIKADNGRGSGKLIDRLRGATLLVDGHIIERHRPLAQLLASCVKEDETCQVVIVTEKALQGYEEIGHLARFTDVLVLPLDRYYVKRKMVFLAKSSLVKNQDLLTVKASYNESGLRTALPVQVETVSEVHISFIYNRPLKKGDCRSFILWIPNDKKMPQINAVCHSVDELEKGQFRANFLLFGVRDNTLKYIRQWIKEEYLLQKAKDTG